MTTKAFAILLFSLAGIFSVSGQTRTVTNADLAKYRAVRETAEKDLRENYAKLGFPSPAELELQNERDAKERSALAERLMRERLVREQLEAEQRSAEAAQESYRPQIPENSIYGGYPSASGLYYFGGSGNYYRPRYPYRGYRFFLPPAYRATPVGVYPVRRSLPPTVRWSGPRKR